MHEKVLPFSMNSSKVSAEAEREGRSGFPDRPFFVRGEAERLLWRLG